LLFFLFCFLVLSTGMATNVTSTGGRYMELSWIPSYFASLGVQTASVGVFAVLPYLAFWVVDVGWAVKADRMRQASGDTRAGEHTLQDEGLA
jgi:hypothetical protein